MPRPAPRSRELADAGIAALTLGVFSTLGDWIWARFLPDGAIVPAVAHGFLFFVLIAAVLGAAARSRHALRRLLVALPLVGIVLAALFYPLAWAIGYLGALLVTWVGMWICLALAQRWARRSAERTGRALVRGLLAAVASGLVFWAVSGMWTAPAAETGYPTRLVYWTLAFLPGLAALLVAPSAERGSPA